MRRREFITLVGGAVAWPLAAQAQQQAPVVGYLSSESQVASAARVAAFRQGLKDEGYVEGQNVAIEYRWANDRVDQLSALAANLVQRRVTAIYAYGPAAPVAKTATGTIPIVFRVGSDPVATGLVSALNRPGGNLTGVTTLGAELGLKRMELLHELVPGATFVATLLNPANTAGDGQAKGIQAAARTLGLRVHVLYASTDREIDNAFAALDKLGAGALLIGNDGFFTNQSEQLGRLAAQHGVPAMSVTREFAASGGLVSYGGYFPELDRQTGAYVGRILKGETPADLPVVQPTKFQLVINLKTAKTLGLTIPLTLQYSADEVIE